MKLLLMTAVVKSSKYITDITVVTCNEAYSEAIRTTCKTHTNGTPDEKWHVDSVSMSQYDNYLKEYRYMAYKIHDDNPGNAIVDVQVKKDNELCPLNYKNLTPFRPKPYISINARDNTVNTIAYHLCYKIDANVTPDKTTKVLLDIGLTTTATGKDGYTVITTANLNNRKPDANANANAGNTAQVGNKAGPVGLLNKRQAPNTKANAANAGTNQTPTQQPPTQQPPTQQPPTQQPPTQQPPTQPTNPIYVQYKLDIYQEEVIVTTTTIPPTPTPTETPNNNKDVEGKEQKKKEDDNSSSTKKIVIALSAVAITGVLSILIFTFVNRRRHFNQEKEKEELFASLPWKMNNSNANNSFRDIGGGASLPQMENALKSPQQNAYNGGYNTMNTTMNSGTMTPNMSGMNNMNTTMSSGTMTPNMSGMNNMNTMNMNNNMNTMNMNNNMNTMNMNNNMNTMNMNNNINTMNMNNNMNTMNMNNNMNTMNMNNNMNTMNMNQNYQQPPNQNYQQTPNQNYQQPPNNMNYMPQQNVNLPPMSTPNMNGVNNNYQNVSTPGSTYAPPGSTYAPATNYNPNYQQPSMNAAYGTPVQQPLQQQPLQQQPLPPQQNFQQQSYPPPTLPQQSFNNSPMQGPYYDTSIDKNDNQSISTKSSGKKKLFVTNGNENDEDQQALLNRTNSEMEEKESINNKADGNKNDENNLIDPKRLSKRVSQINTNESNENECDPDIPVASGYDARELDELTLQIGDKITVKAVYSDGWGWGINNTTKEEGVFPVVCLARKPNLTPSE